MTLPSVPIVTFKNIVVNVTEDGNGLPSPVCPKTIGCSSPNTLINFQIAQRRTETCDYRFDPPDIVDPDHQLSTFIISRDGKMLTVCDTNSETSSAKITLHVYDAMHPHKRGSFDPEVANQPDGTI